MADIELNNVLGLTISIKQPLNPEYTCLTKDDYPVNIISSELTKAVKRFCV